MEAILGFKRYSHTRIKILLGAISCSQSCQLLTWLNRILRITDRRYVLHRSSLRWPSLSCCSWKGAKARSKQSLRRWCMFSETLWIINAALIHSWMKIHWHQMYDSYLRAQDLQPTIIANWKLWIPFQFCNFMFVPPALQVTPEPSSNNGHKLLQLIHIIRM